MVKSLFVMFRVLQFHRFSLSSEGVWIRGSVTSYPQSILFCFALLLQNVGEETKRRMTEVKGKVVCLHLKRSQQPIYAKE